MTLNEELIKAQRIFDRAIDLPSGVRTILVKRECASDATLHERVKQMLAHFEKGSDTLDPTITADACLTSRATETTAFNGSERFRVQRTLGRGGFGTVYEVFDCAWHVKLALKLLNQVEPDSLYRFKQEFRSLSRLRHENLVQLYELFSERERWFFTMQLVDGTTFLDFARVDQNSCDIERVKNTLRQLVAGVQALHQSDHIHRDLKPGNVLVTRNGQVVVLDFGLVRHLSPENSRQTASLVGTPAYMSPEQALRQPLSTSSDWYSVGVMLFQALTGQLPPLPILTHRSHAKGIQEKVEPRAINPEVPQELNEICSQLLDPVPENRPTGEMILRALGEGQPQTVAELQLSERTAGESFVGRTEQIEIMRSAFSETLGGQLNVVLIEGRSGIGKSTLVRRFLSEVVLAHPESIILSGRCHEFESVPYKGLDALIDQLSQYLQRLPSARVHALLPREASLLKRLFPVFGGVAAIADAPTSSDSVPDAIELRQRTFAALRELFARLGDRYPLTVWIDDLQWGDRDSSSFLAELCETPLPPRLLLLLTFRSEERDLSPALQFLDRTFTTKTGILGNLRHLDLKGLSEEDSRNLLGKLLTNKTSSKIVEKIVGEARGHPYYLQELARGLSHGEGMPDDTAEQDLELSSFLRRRISKLPMLSRELLELISLAAQPIPLHIVFAASVSTESECQPDALSHLIRANLARISGGEGERKAEPYHDQVRSVVLEDLSPEIVTARHARLAESLAGDPDTEPQTLMTHYKGAGDLSSAFDAALKAASAAENQLAFDRAAIFYQAAFETGVVPDSRKVDLYQKLADCLGKAGRGWDAAQAYLKAERCADSDSLEMNRLAADQLMRSGHVNQAMVVFKQLCQQIGLKIPTTPRRAINGLVYWRLRTQLRLFFGYPEPRPGILAKESMMRLEVLRTGGVIMNPADPVLAAYFQARHVYEALGAREPHHLATALAVEAGFEAATGPWTPENSLRLMQRAEDIAKSAGSLNTLGFIYVWRAYLDHVSGRIPQGIENSRFAIAFLRGHCTGMAWELTAAHVLLFWFTFWAGYMDEVRELFPQLLREGASRGDVNVEDSLRFLSYYHLSADRPDECLRESHRVLETPGGFHLQQYAATLTCVETYLYMGDYASAREHLLKVWVPLSKSLILRWQIYRILAFFLRGRVALACWLTDRRDPTLRGEVEYYAKRLKGIRSPWCHPMTKVLAAGLAAGDGNRSNALRTLEEAQDGFEKIHLHAYVSAVSYVSGLLQGDEKGLAQVHRAQAFFRGHDFRNPAAFLRMLIPGQWF